MSTQRMVLAVMLVFTTFFAVLTISVIVRKGLDVLTVTSLGVLVLFIVGLVGALKQPPQE